MKNQKEFFKLNLRHDIAMRISSELHICTIFEELYKKEGRYYRRLSNLRTNQIIYEACKRYEMDQKLLNRASIEEIKYLLHTMNMVPSESVNPKNGFCFKNGELILKKNGKIEFVEKPDHIYTFSSDLDFKKNHDKKSIKQFLDDVMPSKSDQTQLIEMLAIAMWPALREKINFDSVLVCFGKGANGKSVLFESIVRCIFGKDAIASVRLESLSKRFQMTPLMGKRINIATENESHYIMESPQIKSITSGDVQIIEKKGIDPFEVEIYSVMFFSINKEPYIGNISPAMLRRLRVINFPNKFVDNPLMGSKNEKKANPELRNPKHDKTIELQRGLLQMMLEAAEKMYKLRKMSQPNADMILELQLKSSHIRQFVDECFEFDINSDIWIRDLYEVYRTYCSRESLLTPDGQRWIDPNPPYDKTAKAPNVLVRKLLELFPDKLIKDRANNNNRKIVGLKIKETWQQTDTADTKRKF